MHRITLRIGLVTIAVAFVALVAIFALPRVSAGVGSPLFSTDTHLATIEAKCLDHADFQSCVDGLVAGSSVNAVFDDEFCVVRISE